MQKMTPIRTGVSTVLLTLLIAGALGGDQGAAKNQDVTFNHHIAPIILNRCASCHRPGGGAPFNLLTYDDVRRRGALIRQVTHTRYMPPWKPEPGYGDLAGNRRLADAELTLIARWIDGGMQEGDPGDLPRVPEARQWQLGTPDLVIAMPEPYQLAPAGSDVFRTFVIPIPVSTGRYVKGIEFLPGTAHAVHHASIKIDPTRSSSLLDEDEAGPGYDGGGSRTAIFPDGHFLAWAPGQSPSMLPEDMGWRLESGSDLVLEMHLMPSGKPESVQARVGLFFTDRPPSRRPFIVRLGSQSIDIPAGDREYLVTDSFVLPVDVEVLAVQPHAHYLAKEIRGYARLPDGTTKWLLFIKDWDFRWQDVYRLREPLDLRKGTTLEMRYTYDNSAANVRNPHAPPQRVTFGQTSSSEMGNLWIQVVTRNTADRAVLDTAYAPKRLAGDIAGYEKMLEITPGDSRLHSDLGFLYVDAGRLSEATTELEASVRLTPNSSAAHYALGTVLLNQKRLEEARQHFTVALQLTPEFADAYINLGVVSHAQGKLDEAIANYSQALRVRPDSPQAHYNRGRAYLSQNHIDQAIVEYRRALQLKADDVDTLMSLGSALASRGHVDEALVRYRRALALNPDHPAALLDLAWILATSTRADIRAPAESVRLAERVADLTGHQNATVLDTLAIAYFAAGRTPDAIRTAEAALALAAASGLEKLVRGIQNHLAQYKGQAPRP